MISLIGASLYGIHYVISQRTSINVLGPFEFAPDGPLPDISDNHFLGDFRPMIIVECKLHLQLISHFEIFDIQAGKRHPSQRNILDNKIPAGARMQMVRVAPFQNRLQTQVSTELEMGNETLFAEAFNFQLMLIAHEGISQDNFLLAAIRAGQDGCMVRPDITF